MRLPEIPKSWLIGMMFLSLVFLRTQGIDTYVTAGISLLIGWVAGKHVESTRPVKK